MSLGDRMIEAAQDPDDLGRRPDGGLNGGLTWQRSRRTGAIYKQIAGTFYGVGGFRIWRKQLSQNKIIARLADMLIGVADL